MTSTRHSGEHIVFLLCSSLQQVATPILINTRCVAGVSSSRLGFHYAQSCIYISIVAGRLRNGSEECITWLLKSVDLWLDNHNCDKGLGSTGGCMEQSTARIGIRSLAFFVLFALMYFDV